MFKVSKSNNSSLWETQALNDLKLSNLDILRVRKLYNCLVKQPWERFVYDYDLILWLGTKLFLTHAINIWVQILTELQKITLSSGKVTHFIFLLQNL